MHCWSPSIPNGRHFYIPVEIKEDCNIVTLEEIQTTLTLFGLDKPTRDIATFIQETPAFTSTLQSGLYPVIRPPARTAVYQSWGYVLFSSFSTPSNTYI